MTNRTVEFIEKNYEIALLASLILYIVLPIYLGIFVVCTVVAAGRGQLYKDRLEEFLQTLAENTKVQQVDPIDTTPIARTKARRRRGSG